MIEENLPPPPPETKAEKQERIAVLRKALAAAELIRSLARMLVTSLKRLCYASAVAGIWLWLLFFHSLILALSPWALISIPVLLSLLTAPAILFRYVLGLEEMIELPQRLREHLSGTVKDVKILHSGTESSETGEAIKTGKGVRLFASIRQLYTQFDFVTGLVDLSGLALSVFNPISKIILLIATVVALVQIVFGGLTLFVYLLVLLVF